MQDSILQDLMYKFDPEQSRSSHLGTLSTIDSASTASSPDSSEIPVSQVPGGTISFIFERFSATIEKGNDREAEEESS